MPFPRTLVDTVAMPTFQRPKSASPTWPMAAPRRRTRANTDTVKLLMLGYKQELAREFTLFNTFGACFNMLSTFTSIGGAYGIGVLFGGPVIMMWGWLLVTLFTASVALSMAELASAYPTSGALYYWSYKLAPPRLKNLACWTTAWSLILAQAAASACVFFTLVHMLKLSVEIQYGVELTSSEELGILVALSFLIGLLNCGTARLTAFMTTLGAWWHLVALAAICLCIPLIAPSRQTAKYIFTSWQPHTEISGITSPVYTALVGLLMSQWCLTGFDGVTHLAEETFDAEYNIPRAIVLTLVGVGVTGFAFLVSLTSAKLNVHALLSPENETKGTNVMMQILIEIAKSYGNIGSGVVLSTIPIVGTFFCSYQVVANNSRMLYAFARDNGVPLSKYAKWVHPRTKTPVCAVVYMLALITLIAAPMCYNYYVFLAITSYAVVACYISYALPVLFKLSTGRRFFLPGPFFLGHRLSYINNVITSLWVLTVTVLFTLPQFYPITLLNLNWSAPILGVAFMFSFGWYYFPKYGARYWFLGPRTNLGQFQDVLPSEQARKAAEAEATQAAAAVAAEKAAFAAAEAAELMTRVAMGSCGGRAPNVTAAISRHSSRRSGGKSTTASPAVTGTGALAADPAEPATAVALIVGYSSPLGGDVDHSPRTTYAGRSCTQGSTSPGRTPPSGASSRRHSALGMMHATPSPRSGFNMGSVLQGMELRDDSSGGGANAASCDGRLWAPEGRPVRHHHSRRVLPRARIQQSPRSSSTGGPLQDRPSSYSRDRLSLLLRAITGSSAGIAGHLPVGAPLRDVVEDAEGNEVQERSSDTSLHDRARLRRASVSVIALQGPDGRGTAAATPPSTSAPVSVSETAAASHAALVVRGASETPSREVTGNGDS